MEFDKSRCFTSLNADELKQGDKVITARCMADLKTWVEADAEPNIIELIQDETNTDRFTCKCYGSNKTYDSPLAYLVERKENCTNCEKFKTGYCVDGWDVDAQKIFRCENYKPKTEQKAEPHYRPFTIREAKEYILQNWFDGAEGVEASIPVDPEYKAMKIAVEILELAEKICGVEE